MSKPTNNWNVNLYNDKHDFVYLYGEDLLKILNQKKGELILDLGCGSGQLAYQISKSKADVIGIDNSKSMIESAKEKYPELDFFVKNAARFQFEKPFDAIFSNAVLHWVTDSENAILSMNKNLKQGGRLVFEFGGKGNVKTIIKSIRKLLKKRKYTKNATIENWYFPSISTYTSLLEKNGFEVEFAHLYDRLTELTDSKNGIKDWIEMFGSSFFIDVYDKDKKDILEEVQNDVKKKRFIDEKWYADYRRIRVLAKKK